MKIFKTLINILKILTVPVACTAALSCTHGDRYIAIQGYAQGGTYSVKLNLNGSGGRIRTSPEKLKSDIDSILNTIDTTLSGYNKGSVLSRLNAGKTVSMDPDGMFADIYSKAYGYYEETGGALDVASGPLFDMWGFGFTRDSLPDDMQVRKTTASCGMRRLKKDIGSAVSQDGRLRPWNLLTDRAKAEADTCGTSPFKLNFNAIAQGYSCDVIAEYLHKAGVEDMLVDIGEIYCDGVNPDGKPWKVGVDRPFDGNNDPGSSLDGIWESGGKPCGIVTSGNYRKYYVKDGKKFAHTIDPRTGYPVQHNLLSATIVASTATDADAYATYCMVIGFEQAVKFIERRKDSIAGYLIYSGESGEMHEWASDNFSLVKP